MKPTRRRLQDPQGTSPMKRTTMSVGHFDYTPIRGTNLGVARAYLTAKLPL